MARLLLSRLPSFSPIPSPLLYRSFSSSPTPFNLPNSPLNDGEKEFAWDLARRYPEPLSKKDVEVGLQTAMKIHGGIWDSGSMSLMRVCFYFFFILFCFVLFCFVLFCFCFCFFFFFFFFFLSFSFFFFVFLSLFLCRDY